MLLFLTMPFPKEAYSSLHLTLKAIVQREQREMTKQLLYQGLTGYKQYVGHHETAVSRVTVFSNFGEEKDTHYATTLLRYFNATFCIR